MTQEEKKVERMKLVVICVARRNTFAQAPPGTHERLRVGSLDAPVRNVGLARPINKEIQIYQNSRSFYIQFIVVISYLTHVSLHNSLFLRKGQINTKFDNFKTNSKSAYQTHKCQNNNMRDVIEENFVENSNPV